MKIREATGRTDRISPDYLQILKGELIF